MGRVVRTVTLLRYLSETGLRDQITAITNRTEAFHGFAAHHPVGPGPRSAVSHRAGVTPRRPSLNA
ncbi:Tn3 family transposase [Pseudofrankia asymbiotica]|uniref:Tn3 family transposase n=1 Tax=Pseudofrankia asymbiotica TaxID=1834516 RepID=UPI0009761FA3